MAVNIFLAMIYWYSFFAAFLAVLSIYFLSDDFVFKYYFIVAFFCGVLVAKDFVEWLMRRKDSFDPAFLISIPLFFIVFVSPVMQVTWDFWPYLPPLTYDEDWIFYWFSLNAIGLLIYRAILDLHFYGVGGARIKTFWYIDEKKFIPALKIAIFVAVLCQAFIYAKFGGVSSFVDTFTERQAAGVKEEDPFEGLGVVTIIAESFKYCFSMLVIYKLRNSDFAKTNKFLFLMVLCLFVIFLPFGGLRGSRSSTIFAIFFAVGMYHLWIRKLTVANIISFILFGSIFISGYYWYKVAGLSGIGAIFDDSQKVQLHESRQDSTKYIIARDLGRMDIQALALREMLADDGRGPDFALGRTYVTAVFAIIPRAIFPKKPPQITKEKTEIIYGNGAYDPNAARQTTLVLGQFGEMFVNFGIAGIFLYYSLLAIFIGKVREMIFGLNHEDARKFILPVLCFLPILFLITDFNVIFQQVTRYLMVPVLVIYYSCRKFSWVK